MQEDSSGREEVEGRPSPKPRRWVSFEGLEGFGLPASFDAKEIIS